MTRPSLFTNQAPSIVLIVGAGQLGSRYLQGLAVCKSKLRIYVVDLNPKALSVAQERWANTSHLERDCKVVTFHSSIYECPNQADLAIIATTANNRYEVVCSLKKNILIHYWILEKVLTQSSNLLRQLQSQFTDHSMAWVNTP